MNIFFFPFSVWPRLPTLCTCRGLLLHLITFSDTHTPLDRIPLDDGSARRRDLYLTTHIHRTQIPTSTTGFETTVPANERPQTHALDLAVTGISCYFCIYGKLYGKYKMRGWGACFAVLLLFPLGFLAISFFSMSRGLACCINPPTWGPGDFWSRFSSSSSWYASIKLQGSGASFGPPRVFY